MTAACDKDDLDPLLVGSPQGIEISRCDLKLGVQQCAVDINGKKADGRRHWRDSSIPVSHLFCREVSLPSLRKRGSMPSMKTILEIPRSQFSLCEIGSGATWNHARRICCGGSKGQTR